MKLNCVIKRRHFPWKSDRKKNFENRSTFAEIMIKVTKVRSETQPQLRQNGPPF